MPDKVFNNQVISNDTVPEVVMPQEKTSKEQVMQVVADKIFSTDNIKVKTELKTKQIIPLSICELYAEDFDCDIYAKFANEIMTLSVSLNRGSRKEFTEISRSMANDVDAELKPNLKTRLGF
ncbi:MAG: hypothetical protein AB7V16_13220 [Vulcanibacillus sp.]